MNFLNKLFGNKNENQSESIQNTEMHCPNCNELVGVLPKRKKRCNNCKNYFYPHKRDSIHILISEEEYQKIKEEQEKASFIKKWVYELSRFGISEKAYFDYKKNYAKKIKSNENDNDVIWSLFNKLISENSRNYDTLKNIYFSMSHFVREEGKDGFKYLQLSHDAELRGASQANISLNAVILTAKDSCDNCKRFDGKSFTIQEALEIKPLPHIGCSSSFCRCGYGFEPIRDRNGNLIL